MKPKRSKKGRGNHLGASKNAIFDKAENEASESWVGFSSREFCVVVPILNPNMAEGLVRLAIALAGINTPEGVEEKRRARIVVLGIVTVPEEAPLSQGTSLVKAYRTLLRYIPSEAAKIYERVEVKTDVRVAREVWQGIADQAQEEQADLLLLHWKGLTQTPNKIYGSTIDALMDDPPCDIVLARFNFLPEIRKILLPVRGGSYSSLAMRLVSNLAGEWGSKITVMHNVVQKTGGFLSNPDASGEITQGDVSTLHSPKNWFQNPTSLNNPGPLDEDSLNTLQNIINDLPPTARLLTTTGQLEQVLANETKSYDFLVLGASEEARNKDGLPINGPSPLFRRLTSTINIPLLVVKTRKPFRLSQASSTLNQGGELVEVVDRWFAQNTFHYREFRSLSSLTILKERNKTSISLVFPVYGPTHPIALAEKVKRARIALMRDCALLDEIIVSSPGVKLDENEIALIKAKAGIGDNEEEAIIFLGTEEAAEPEEARGPGPALWRALQLVRGDLVVWADPHYQEFDARIFYGLLGPLLTYPEFLMSIGFYSHPMPEEAEQSLPIHNELVEMAARPILGGLFPTLAGVINPLLLIGAARRDHLEHLPLFTGTAFTPGLLIDTLARAGLMSIAQVDLGEPPAQDNPLSNQRIISDLLDLTLRRSEERTQGTLRNNFNSGTKKVRKTGGVFSIDLKMPLVPVKELPPLYYNKSYQRNTFLPTAEKTLEDR